MARSWHYPRWRRALMQVVLWLVFGGTLGLAGLVVRHKRLAGTADLAGAKSVDLPGGVRVGVRLPRGWRVDLDAGEHDADATGDAPGDLGKLFEAQEPAGGVRDPGAEPDADGPPVGRLLVVRRQRVATVGSAAEYLKASGLLHGAFPATGDPEAGPTAGPTAVAGVDGVWVAVHRPVQVGTEPEPVYVTAYLAAGVTPSGWAVSVELDCPPTDPDPAADRELLRRVAGAISVNGGP